MNEKCFIESNFFTIAILIAMSLCGLTTFTGFGAPHSLWWLLLSFPCCLSVSVQGMIIAGYVPVVDAIEKMNREIKVFNKNLTS